MHCVLTMYNVCAVPWGISWVPWGISWVPWGVQYRGGYHDKCGGYLEYREGISWVPWGVILSIVGGVQYRGGISWCTRGGYHEYRGGIPSFEIWVPWGCSVPWGNQITKDFPPTFLNTPHGTHDIPTDLKITSTVLMISSTVMNTPTVLKISPHGSEHPHGTAHTLYRVVLAFIAKCYFDLKHAKDGD